MKRNEMITAVYAACAGMVLAILTVAVWVSRIDPASGMGM